MKKIEQPEESQEENDNGELSSKKETPAANKEDRTIATDTDSTEHDENSSEENIQEKAIGSDAIEQGHEISAKSYPVEDLLLVRKI